MFLPKRIYVKPQSRTASKTKEIIDRAKKLDPAVEIIYLNSKGFNYPAGLTSHEKFLHMKESVIISERSEQFIRTFPSPGNIVENFNTVLNYTWMCPCNCEYCYLQTNQTLEHYFYTNLRELEKEFIVAPHAHRAILTIWSMLSIAKKQTLNKIPPGMEDYSNLLRETFLKNVILGKRRSIDWIFLKQKEIYKHLRGDKSLAEFGIDEKDFRFSLENIKNLYEKNEDRKLRMIPSEYCDMVAVEHLTGNLKHLSQMIGQVESVEVDVRTKSNQLEAIRTFPGHGRIKFGISLNTDYVISQYEHGTSTLDERLQAACTVQEADGYNLDLILEPFIKYDDCVQDYKNLIGKIANAIDLNKVRKISIGSIRYRKQLRDRILHNYPETNLFHPSQDLQEPEEGDHRLRYSVDYLADVYTIIRSEIAKYSTVPVKLGAEKRELWDRLKLDADKHISQSVYQYSGLPMDKMKELSEKKDVTVKSQKTETSDGEHEEFKGTDVHKSLQFLCAQNSAQLNDEMVDPHLFPYAEYLISKIDVKSEQFSADDGTTVEIDIDLWDTVEPVTIATAREKDNLWHPVKITGRLVSISEAAPVTVYHDDDTSSTNPTRVIEFFDKNQDKIKTLAFPESLLPANINEILKSQKQVTFLGSCVSVYRKDKFYFRFYLHRFIAESKMSDLVSRKKSEQFDSGFTVLLKNGVQLGVPSNHPYILVEKYGYNERRKQDGTSLFNYIKNSVMDNLKIMGGDRGAQHLERGLEFVILQALSQGMSEGFSNKLHGMIIGPPNVGKSKLTDAAKAINPIAAEMGDVSAKHTAAGMIGKVKDAKGVSMSTGGILPSSSGGVVCVQDFHLMESNSRKTFFALSSLFMEKGFVRDDTSANASLETVISLLVDTNRYHQVNRSNPPAPNSYADLDVPINILSRFDFILEIPKDSDRQEQVSDHLSMTSSKSKDQWQSEIKDLIAFLRDNYNMSIIVSKEVDDYSKTELQKLFVAFKSANFERTIEDHRIRIQRSLKKYLQAIACAWARPVITKDHVDFALKFIQDKISFLASQSFDVGPVDGRSERKEDRKSVVLDHFKDKVFTTSEMKVLYEKIYPMVNLRNVQRDLDAWATNGLITRIKHGTWQLTAITKPIATTPTPKKKPKITTAKKAVKKSSGKRVGSKSVSRKKK